MGRLPSIHRVKKDPVAGRIEEIRRLPSKTHDKRQRERRYKGLLLMIGSPCTVLLGLGMGVYLAFFAWLGLWGPVVGLGFGIVMLISSVLLFLLGMFILYDTKKIPDDWISMPNPIALSRDEAWRQSTPLRYLEDTKKSITQMEDKAEVIYRRARQGFDSLVYAQGYSDYDFALSRINYFRRFKNEYERLLSTANRVFAGEAEVEIKFLESKIKTYRLDRGAFEETFAENYAEPNPDLEQGLVRKFLRQWDRQKLKRSIKDIDLEIIEIESYIEELKAFDFTKLNRVPQKSAPEHAGLDRRQAAQERIAELRRDKAKNLEALRAAGEGEDAIRRRENTFDDAIERAEQNLRELL